MVYDAQRGKTMLFGGAIGINPTKFNDTWEWDGNAWTQLHPAVAPSPRSGHRMVFDTARNKTVLFGGTGYSGDLSDTWEWDGSAWSSMAPSASPQGRSNHGLAFDSARGRVVLYGGGANKDTWEWDGANWIMKTPANTPSTYGERLAYDSSRGVCVLFNPDAPSNLWKWNGVDWAMVNFPGGPGMRWGSSCYFDGQAGRLVTFGGTNLSRVTGEVWTWDGTTWTLAVAAGSPYGFGGLCYDIIKGRSVGLGPDEIWEWDGNVWSRRAPTPRPVRTNALGCSDYDIVRGKTVLFLGKPQRATWEWDGSAWTQRFPFVSPPDYGVMAYDSARQRMVFYEGVATKQTWEWDGNFWTLKASGVGPPGYGAMAYDAARSQMVWAGGYVFNTTSPMQTWTWDGSQWQLRVSTTAPVARSSAGIAYDARRQVVVLFGGETTNLSTGTTLRDDVWEWDGSIWTGVGGIRPAPQFGAQMTYDPQRACIVLFGNDGTWEYGPSQMASCVPYGLGCGAGATPVLASDRGSVPWLGGTFQSKLTNLGSSGPGFVMLGDSKSVWGSYALPLDLGFIGMTNCSLLANPLLSFGVGNVGGSASWSLTLPNYQRYAGASLYAQGGGMNGSANPLGIVVSNGLTLTAGWK